MDILVNNAGFGTTSLLAEHDAEDARTVCVVCSAYGLHAVMAVQTCMVRHSRNLRTSPFLNLRLGAEFFHSFLERS